MHVATQELIPATQCVATGIQIILYGLPVTIQHNEKYSEPDFTLPSSLPSNSHSPSTYYHSLSTNFHSLTTNNYISVYQTSQHTL